jgi:hypothetical protein
MISCERGWAVICDVDEDGHLNLWVSHEDGSKVIDCEIDPSIVDDEYGLRFTTAKIERDYACFSEGDYDHFEEDA